MMGKVSLGHKKEWNRLLNFVTSNGMKGLKMKLTKESIWKIEVYWDSNFGGNKNGRRSITGFIVMACNDPISWKSKSQGNVTLSSTEAGYLAPSETGREVKFIAHVLDSLEIKYEKLIKMNVDNFGAMFLFNNKTS